MAATSGIYVPGESDRRADSHLETMQVIGRITRLGQAGMATKPLSAVWLLLDIELPQRPGFKEAHRGPQLMYHPSMGS